MTPTSDQPPMPGMPWSEVWRSNQERSAATSVGSVDEYVICAPLATSA